MWLHQGPEFFLYVEELLPNKPTVADPHWKLKKTSVQSHILIINDYATDDLRKQLQNLHAFSTTSNTKLWRWKLGVFFLKSHSFVICIQFYNNIKWCSSFWTRWMCNIFLYLIGTDRLCNCCFYKCHEAIVYQWDA